MNDLLAELLEPERVNADLTRIGKWLVAEGFDLDCRVDLEGNQIIDTFGRAVVGIANQERSRACSDLVDAMVELEYEKRTGGRLNG